METKLELFKNVMYYMNKTGTLPELDTEDLEVMFSALRDYWEIRIEDWKWEKFINDINVSKSDNLLFFSDLFDTYFYE